MLPGGGCREFSYNPYGKIIAERDELGHVTRWDEYADGLHLISRRPNADGTQVKYRYDNARLLLTEIENEAGETYQLDYHPNGLIRQETGFDGQRTAYVYDLNGNLLEKTEYGDDGSQLVTRYERDHAGRLVRKILPDASVVDYAYDRQGNLYVEDGHWALAYEYDRQNRLTAEHQGWGTLRYGYDACGQLKNLCLPDNNRLTFTHKRRPPRHRRTQRSAYLAPIQERPRASAPARPSAQPLPLRRPTPPARPRGNAATKPPLPTPIPLRQKRQPHPPARHSQRRAPLPLRPPRPPDPRRPLPGRTGIRFAHNPAGNLLMQDRPRPGHRRGESSDDPGRPAL